jgi:hypothetical protein
MTYYVLYDKQTEEYIAEYHGHMFLTNSVLGAKVFSCIAEATDYMVDDAWQYLPRLSVHKVEFILTEIDK